MAHIIGPFPLKNSDDFAERVLSIHKSNIPLAGLGVFATEPISKGTVLGRYAGIGMNKAALDARYGEGVALYALTVQCTNHEDCGWPQTARLKHRLKHETHRVCIDAKDSGNWACRINDGPHSGFASNVAFSYNGSVYATSNIRKGEELYADYGTEYW